VNTFGRDGKSWTRRRKLKEQRTTQRSNTGTQTAPHRQQKRQHPNIPTKLIPTETTNYSLWKTIKKIKQIKKDSAPLRTSQETWARTNIEKAHAFAKHLA
jgi:hypothetical protein